MTSDRSKAFWLGIFVILAILVVAWLFLFLKPTVGDGKKTLKIRFTNVEGVTIGTRITFGGKPVGTVVAIREISDARSQKVSPEGSFYFYEVVADVDSKVNIYNYDQIAYTTQGLLGEKSIEITPKATPKGSPPAHEVTGDILYARSTSQLEAALQQLQDVAASFQETVEKVSDLLDSGTFDKTMDSITVAATRVSDLVERTLEVNFLEKTVDAADSLKEAMNSANLVVTRIVDEHLVEKISQTVGDLGNLSHKITHSEGTLGRLLNSDSFYLQLTALMCKFETLLSDINNYGLLFQYDKKWQRQRVAKMRQMEMLCTSEDFTHFFNKEMCDICVTLDRVSKLLCEMECREVPIANECFSESFSELIGRVEHLLMTLKNYNQMLYKEYCH